MERDTHLAKLREWFTLLQSEQARRFTTSTNECAFTTALGWALEQLRDAAPRVEEPPIELTDDMIHQMLGEAEAAYNRARSDAGGSGEGHRVQHEFGKFAKAETVRSYLFQAGILPAPVGRQTPTEPQQTSRSELMRHAVQRGGRPMDVAATVGEQTPARSTATGFDPRNHTVKHEDAGYVGGQTPTEPPAHDCEQWRMEGMGCRRCNPISTEMQELARRIDAELAAPPPPGAPPAFTREDVINMAEGIEFNGLKYDDSGQSTREAGEMLRAYAQLLPTEGRQETK